MARPQRNNVDYFPHYISDGKKMFYFESKYGNDGYAMWFKLLEKLAQTEFHYIDFEDETELMYMAAKCRVSEEVFISFLNELSKFGEINSELWNECRVVWSDKFVNSIQDAYSKRSNKCQSFDGLRSSLLSLGRIKGSVKPQSKVKETKENKNIEERKREFYNSLIPYVETYGKEMVKEFYDYWTEHSPNQRKFRMEKETAFDLSKRLATWKKKKEEWNNGKLSSSTPVKQIVTNR